jgi:hypothetical protein
MAKAGNRGGGPVNNTKGPCTDCGQVEGPFMPTKRYGPTGRKQMVKLCGKCYTKI